MELVILKGLEWGLAPMTPNSWVKIYLQANQATTIAELVGKVPPGSEDMVSPLYTGQPYSRIMKLLDLCILDIGSLAFPYSVLSASAIYLFLDKSVALRASGISALKLESFFRDSIFSLP